MNRPARTGPRVAALPTLLTAGALLLAGCTAAPAPGDQPVDRSGNAEPEPAQPGNDTHNDTGTEMPGNEATYPVTVDNCGTDVTVNEPPERIVTIKSTTFELVLALGLADSVVGHAFLDGPVPPELADAAAGVPELAERDPSTEAVLATDPDLIFAGWESTFTDEGLGSRGALHELDIATYVSPPACQGEGYMPDPLTFEHIADQIHQAGEIFGVPEAAAGLVAEQESQLEQVQTSEAGLSALWYSSGSDTPFVGAGIGAPQLLMETAGLENIAGDVDDTWVSMSWEAVADAEPDVIVLVDSDWNTAEHKISVMADVPAMAALPAVAEGRYLVLDFPATEAGIRSAAAAADLAEQVAAVESEWGSELP